MNEVPERGAAVAAPPKKSRRGLAVGIVAALVVIGAAAWFFFGRGGSGMADFFDPNATTGILPGMTDEQIIEELNRIVEEGMFNISINTQISFPNGTAEGQAYIDNISANHYNMTVQIVLDDTGESVYQSGGIRPGQYIENITLSKALPKGSYKATAIFTAHDPEDQSEVGQAAAEVLLTVES